MISPRSNMLIMNHESTLAYLLNFVQENAEKEEEAAPAVDQEMSGVEKHSGDAKSSINRQNDKLYTAEGILDPRKKRAEKKRRKARKVSMMDEDYDFKIDYFNKESDPKDTEDTDDIDEGGEVPMSGVEVDV